MRVIVDFDKCESNGLCVSTVPEVFQFASDESLEILNEQPDESLRERLIQAVTSCPAEAISLVD